MAMTMDKFEVFEKALCRELDILEQKFRGGAEMNPQDLDRLDKISHAMKSLETYKAMKEAEEYGRSEDGMSGRRGRGTDGRYVSRDGGRSYADGYSQGYAAAMSQMSGHYPYPPNM